LEPVSVHVFENQIDQPAVNGSGNSYLMIWDLQKECMGAFSNFSPDVDSEGGPTTVEKLKATKKRDQSSIHVTRRLQCT
jgi:hypothetical protein